MLNQNIVNILKSSKNLLAFSAGVDSTALFFILLEHKISFDIAIVNYNLREEALAEIEYAKNLAKKFNKNIFIANAPKFNSNFEKNARDFRYEFFKDIVKSKGYKNLITAHQLNDKLEWFLMRLSKGAGVSELYGIDEFEQRDGYKLIRPLINYTKEELLDYLDSKNIKYFIDKSNFELKYERNRFRPLVNELLKEGKSGFLKSFNILKSEKEFLNSSYKVLFKKEKLFIIEFEKRELVGNIASKYLKEFGYLISGKERELLKIQNSLVAGRKWAIEIEGNRLYIAPYIKAKLSKEFKEYCRKNKIPAKVRGYLFSSFYKY